jgi:signal transduction histidine kinase
MPIRVRMTLWYGVLLALVVTAVGAFVLVRLRSDLIASIDRNLAPASRQITTGYEREGIGEFTDSSASLLAGERAVSQVLTRDGRVVAEWGDVRGRRPLIRAATVGAVPFGPHTLEIRPHGDFRVIARPITHFGQRQVVVTAVSTEPVERSVARVRSLLLLSLPVAFGIIAAGGWWLAGRALRPIERMTTTAAGIDADELDRRVPDPGSRDEVGRLAETLNGMLARVERGVNEQRQLVADASHELRTPLAAMRSELDVSLRLDDLPPEGREVLESVREEVDALTHTVAGLLTLARADAGELSLHPERFELAPVARDVADSLAGFAAANGVSVRTLGDGAQAVADPGAVRQVLRNLIENAIEFSPAGGEVEVRSDSGDGVVRVSVLDDGPGIPSELRERVFERFYRADSSRSRRTGGSGLGLAIARELVVAQGGRVWVDPGQPAGAAFTVELPSA